MLVTRRYITKGSNFDVVVGIDLHDRKDIEGLRTYLQTRILHVGSFPPHAQRDGTEANT